MKKGKKRKCNTDYLQIGFYFGRQESEPKPVCVICYEVLVNSNSNPSLLRRYLETRHSDYKDETTECFKNEFQCDKKCGVASFLLAWNEGGKMALEPSFWVSFRIARSGQAHNMAANSIRLCAKDITTCTLGEQGVKTIGL